MTDPLTPPECDLHDYPWLPLDVTRLLASETWVLGTAEEKVAALTLWMRAWHQIPAASVPDNERMLAHLSGAGAAWPKVRDHAMRAWIKCTDGRLYHPVVAEKANESWLKKLAQKERTEAARRAKAAKKAASDIPPTSSVTESVTETVTRPVARLVTAPVTQSVTEPVTASTGQDRTGHSKEERTVLRTTPDGAFPDARTELFQAGLAIVVALTGKPPGGARAILGKLLKTLADDCPGVMAMLREAQQIRPIEPIPWLIAAAESRRPGRKTKLELIAEEWDLPALRWHNAAPDEPETQGFLQ